MPDARLDPFTILLAQLEFGALVGLGIVENPATKEKKREPLGAKVFIDQMEMLAVKTRGNLSADEARALEESLFRVRMLFVQTAGGEAVEKQE